MIPSVSLLPELAAVFSLEYERSHSIENALACVLRAPGLRRAVLAGRIRDERKVNDVLKTVCAFYGIGPKELLRRGDGRCSRRRFVAAWCLRDAGISLTQSAIALGLDNHTSVYYGVHQVDASAELKADAEEISRRFRSASGGAARESVETIHGELARAAL